MVSPFPYGIDRARPRTQQRASHQRKHFILSVSMRERQEPRHRGKDEQSGVEDYREGATSAALTPSSRLDCAPAEDRLSASKRRYLLRSSRLMSTISKAMSFAR